MFGYLIKLFIMIIEDGNEKKKESKCLNLVVK